MAGHGIEHIILAIGRRKLAGKIEQCLGLAGLLARQGHLLAQPGRELPGGQRYGDKDQER